MNELATKLTQQGYEIGIASGPTSKAEKRRQRDAGWLWEGDEIPKGFPEHLILRDDSDDPIVYRVSHPELGISLHVTEDDAPSWIALLEGHPERVRQQEETTEETMERLGIALPEGS